eukprot:2088098-Prorocentrum_lima.AAC.1
MLGAILGPRQVAIGHRAGTEVLAHSLQLFVEGHPRAVLVATDFSNAFGTVSREAGLQRLREVFPEGFMLAEQFYTRPS